MADDDTVNLEQFAPRDGAVSAATVWMMGATAGADGADFTLAWDVTAPVLREMLALNWLAFLDGLPATGSAQHLEPQAELVALLGPSYDGWDEFERYECTRLRTGILAPLMPPRGFAVSSTTDPQALDIEVVTFAPSTGEALTLVDVAVEGEGPTVDLTMCWLDGVWLVTGMGDWRITRDAANSE